MSHVLTCLAITSQRAERNTASHSVRILVGSGGMKTSDCQSLSSLKMMRRVRAVDTNRPEATTASLLLLASLRMAMVRCSATFALTTMKESMAYMSSCTKCCLRKMQSKRKRKGSACSSQRITICRSNRVVEGNAAAGGAGPAVPAPEGAPPAEALGRRSGDPARGAAMLASVTVGPESDAEPCSGSEPRRRGPAASVGSR